MKFILLFGVSMALVSLLKGCSSETHEENIEWGKCVLAEHHLNDLAHNLKFNGQALLTQQEGRECFLSVGFRNREEEESFKSDDIFLIGSITKPFTAALILQLADKGALNLEDSIGRFKLGWPPFDDFTIRQLLNHTSGIRDYHEFPDWKEKSMDSSLTPQMVLDQVAKDPYRDKAGARFRYSNSGYILLGILIEKLHGQSFEACIDQEILTPLGLERSGVLSGFDKPEFLVRGYRTNPNGVFKADEINYNQPFSSGNMYSSLKDLKLFSEAFFKGDLFSNTYVSEMLSDSGNNYLFGWGIRRSDSLRSFGHIGAMNGFVGAIRYRPESKAFVGYLSNDDNTPRNTVISDLTKISLGQETVIPTKKNYGEIPEQEARKIVGNYLVKKGDTLSVYQNAKEIWLKETGQEAHQMFRFGEMCYDFEKLEFDLVFETDSNDEVIKLVFQKEMRNFLEASRLEE